jgi:hypothetical protein
MQEIIFLVEESLEGGYQARALGHSIFTEAETMEELKVQVRDAVICHFDGPQRPRLIRLHLVRDELIPV